MIGNVECKSKFSILRELEEINTDFGKEPEAWVIITILSSDGTYEKRVIHQTHLSNLKISQPIGFDNQILDVLSSGKSTGFFTIKDQFSVKTEYIVEVIRPLNSLLILGAGHVGRSLSLIASILGYEVTLIDDREEFLVDQQILHSGGKKVCLPFENFSQSVAVTSNSAIVIVTRGHQSDEVCLRNAIYTNAKYIGMIGSKRRVLAILGNLKKSGLSEKQLTKLENVFAPIGLEIGAKSPQEIAVSILAQIIQIMNRD